MKACECECSQLNKGIATGLVAKAEIEREIRTNVGEEKGQYGVRATGSTVYKRSKHETIRFILEGFSLN